jgi:signal transduction histidine kinase
MRPLFGNKKEQVPCENKQGTYLTKHIRMSEHDEISYLIRQWKINKPLLAEKIGMNNNTFRLKIDKNQSRYHFSEEEKKRIAHVLKQMAMDVIATIHHPNFKY